MFIVLYRWRLVSELEDIFIGAWSEVTKFYLENCDSLGSRLHKGDDGIWYAYAQWKTSEQRKKASEKSSELKTAFKKMNKAIEERFPEVLLDARSDFLKTDI